MNSPEENLVDWRTANKIEQRDLGVDHYVVPVVAVLLPVRLNSRSDRHTGKLLSLRDRRRNWKAGRTHHHRTGLSRNINLKSMFKSVKIKWNNNN